MKDIKDKLNFDIGTLTQMESNSGTPVKGTVVKPPQVTVNPAVINFGRPIIVQPVVNLNSKDLSRNEKGEIVVPKIKVELTININ